MKTMASVLVLVACVALTALTAMGVDQCNWCGSNASGCPGYSPCMQVMIGDTQYRIKISQSGTHDTCEYHTDELNLYKQCGPGTGTRKCADVNVYANDDTNCATVIGTAQMSATTHSETTDTCVFQV